MVRRNRSLLLAAVVAVTVAAFAPSAGAIDAGRLAPAAGVRGMNNVLDGVACVTRSHCVAAGSAANTNKYLIESYRGKTWSVVPSPEPKHSESNYFAGISCSASSACTAVGTGDGEPLSGAFTSVPAAERWNGKHWTPQKVPATRHGDGGIGNFYGVSCPTKTTCVAVGESGNYSVGEVQRTLGERWDGKRWHVQLTPSRSSPTGGTHLMSVSCRTSHWCLAVGYIGYTPPRGSITQPIAELWTGHGEQWKIMRLPAREGAERTYLDGVSCASKTSCTAVGYDFSGLYDDATAEHWNGHKWSVQTVPSVEQSYTSLAGVSCPTTMRCVAVGAAQSVITNGSLSLVEEWDGSAWTIDTVPPVAGPGIQPVDDLEGVSCVTATSCSAVGSYLRDAKLGSQPLAYQLHGGSWTAQKPPRS